MAQNFSKNYNEYKDSKKSVTVKDYLDYSNTADIPAMQINDLVVNESDKKENTSENLLHLEMISTNIANRIEDELAKFWTSKQVIRSIIREINKQNVFNFVKNMLTISDSRTVLGDIKNYISYYELKHILQSFLAVAEDLGCSDSSKFKILLKEYKNISDICLKNSNKGIDKNILTSVNLRLEKLFEEISMHVH